MTNKEFLLDELDGEVKCGLCGSRELKFLAMIDTNGNPVTVYCDGHYCDACEDERWVIPIEEQCENEQKEKVLFASRDMVVTSCTNPKAKETGGE